MSSSNAMGGIGDRRKEVVVCRDRDDLGRQTAARFLRYAMKAVAARGRFSVALSGGSTPKTLYQTLAKPPFAAEIPWKGVHLFWGDERAVPPDHPDSNYRTAYETLIAHVPIPAENVHRMPAEKSDLQAAAEAYEETLRAFFHPPPGEAPSFDLVLLGIGPDGHVASLFPGSPALKERKRWVIAVDAAPLKSRRLTLTLPVLDHAARVFFLAAGKEKATIIRELFSDHPASATLPARLIHPRKGTPIFFLDREAADLIGEKEKGGR